MSHTYAQNTVHLVFSTKNREKSMPPDFQPRLWAYVAGICKREGIFAHRIGGVADHIHLLIQIPPSLALAKAVNTVKANSSRWAHEQGHRFSWQQGYAAFSVSASLIPTVGRYVQDQATHHKKMTFETEFQTLLKRHGIEFDANHVMG